MVFFRAFRVFRGHPRYYGFFIRDIRKNRKYFYFSAVYAIAPLKFFSRFGYTPETFIHNP